MQSNSFQFKCTVHRAYALLRKESDVMTPLKLSHGKRFCQHVRSPTFQEACCRATQGNETYQIHLPPLCTKLRQAQTAKFPACSNYINYDMSSCRKEIGAETMTVTHTMSRWIFRKQDTNLLLVPSHISTARGGGGSFQRSGNIRNL